MNKTEEKNTAGKSGRSLQVRHLTIDFSKGFPRHWLGNDAFRSQLFNAQSFSFPLGEQYFIDSVRAALPLLTDEALKADVKGFIGQEASHRHIHEQYNQQLNAQGLSYFIEPFVAWRIRTAAGLGVKNNLAITMAYEHFTAIFADGVLSEAKWVDDATEPMKQLWTWHSIEETEHKSVAFDVYQALGGGYWRRVAWLVYVTMLFSLDTTVQTMHCLYRDGELFKLKTLWQGLKFYFGRRGLLWFSLPHYLAYFKPGFQPWQHDNLDLTRQWLQDEKHSYREIGKSVELGS
ncbi:metal-dependent hydrolase [Undibacterium sp. TJN19]|uniref:metal-dependent hydrolase n=1 Tax=Undibacterium sp. TJN19 TaxID=3413055 RepID=UPI003BEF5256